LDFFEDLGLTLLDRWRRLDLDVRAFPDLAVEALSRRPPSAHVDPGEVLRRVLGTAPLPAQEDLDAKFGQPPITVFRCEAFHVDVLFWVDGTTSIHQHGFSGAFHVMSGSSLHSRFAFDLRRRCSDTLLFGSLKLLEVELLKAGEARPILSGPALVHSLFHLDRPTVSVVVRTFSDPFAGPQYTYSRTGLAYDPFARPERCVRQMQVLDLLEKTGDPAFEAQARDAVQQADAFVAFRLLEHLAPRIRPERRYREFVQSVRPAHAELVDVVEAYVEEERRSEAIAARRNLTRHPEHRFFLALVLNLTERATILDLVGRAFPGVDPVATVHRWIAELAKLDEVHAWVAETAHDRRRDAEARVLDIRPDPITLAAARQLLDGVADPAVARHLAAAGGSVSEDDVLARCAALRSSPMLRPLFGT
jgi:hypothetical protein